MKELKKVACLIIIIAMMFSIAGCGGKKSSGGKSVASSEIKGSLTVYHFKSALYSEAIKNFQSQYSSVKVNAVEFTDANKMDAQIATEIAAKKGADVLLLDAKSTTLDTLKMAKNGAFVDLKDYVSADAGVTANYFNGILDAGKINGGQYLMPIGFDIASLYTSKEMLERQGISLSENYTFDEIKTVILENIEALKNDNNKSAVFSIQSGVMPWLEMTGVQVIDFENKKITITKEQMKEYADLAKAVAGENKKTMSIVDKYKTDFKGTFSNITFTIRPDFFLSGAAAYDMWFKDRVNETYKFLTLPKADAQNERVGIVWLYGTANANTKNPDAAYALLSSIMNYPSDQSVQNYGKYPSSVNKKLIDVNIDSMKTKKNAVGDQMLSNSLAEEVTLMFDSISLFTIKNAAVHAIIEETMSPYISNSKSFNDCFSEMTNKINLYLSE